MKCIQAEKSILLENSGELGTTAERELERHLAGCPSCRDFRQMLTETADRFTADAEPPVRIVQDVLRQIRTSAPVHRHLTVRGWKPAIAVAASLVIALGLYLGNYTGNRIGMEMVVAEAQLLPSEDQVISIMYEGLSEDDLAFNFLMTYMEDIEG